MLPTEAYHRVFMGRLVPGDIGTEEVWAWQCWGCCLIFETEAGVRAHDCQHGQVSEGAESDGS